MIDKKLSQNLNHLASTIQQNSATLELFLNDKNIYELESNGGIYICTYKKDPRYVYIGKTNDFLRRWREHSNDLIKLIHCGEFGQFFIDNNCELTDFEWKILDKVDVNNTNYLSMLEKYRIRQYDNDNFHILLNTIKYRR